MADLEWPGPIDEAVLRRAVRLALRGTEPAWRIVAEDFLAASSRIDLLAVGEAGELIAIRIASPDPADGGTRLLAQGLADLAWLAARASDLARFAPDQGLSAVAPPRAVLIGNAFDQEVETALQAIAHGLGPGRVEALRLRPVRHQAQLTVLLERSGRPAPPASEPEPGRPASTDAEAPATVNRDATAQDGAPPPRVPDAPSDAPAPPAHAPGRRLTDPPSPSGFRSGLVDADLRRSTPTARP